MTTRERGTSVRREAPTAAVGVRLVIVCHLVLVLAAGALHAAQKDSEESTRVALGNVSGPPKTKVMVPLYLTPASGDLRVGSISAAIGFDSKMVSFIKAEKGFLLEGAEGTVRSEIQKGAEGSNHSVLLLDLSTRGEPRKSFKEGLLVTLTFEVAPQAVPGKKVTLEFEKASAEDLSTPPQNIEPLSTHNGIIEILPSDALPYVPCFLFSH